jgi:hypothetical protein
VPDLSDPTFIAYAQKLLNALGARYDGNPNLAFVDIGMVGSWGEWHNSNFLTLRRCWKNTLRSSSIATLICTSAASRKRPKSC